MSLVKVNFTHTITTLATLATLATFATGITNNMEFYWLNSCKSDVQERHSHYMYNKYKLRGPAFVEIKVNSKTARLKTVLLLFKMFILKYIS